jgi:methionine synthase I (cobalamin-dependent)
VLILDGAMGTMIQRYKLTRPTSRRALQNHRDLRGNKTSRSPSDVIGAIHGILEAGADIIETKFPSTAIAQQTTTSNRWRTN